MRWVQDRLIWREPAAGGLGDIIDPEDSVCLVHWAEAIEQGMAVVAVADRRTEIPEGGPHIIDVPLQLQASHAVGNGGIAPAVDDDVLRPLADIRDNGCFVF